MVGLSSEDVRSAVRLVWRQHVGMVGLSSEDMRSAVRLVWRQHVAMVGLSSEDVRSAVRFARIGRIWLQTVSKYCAGMFMEGLRNT
jgi:hypothetical protein